MALVFDLWLLDIILIPICSTLVLFIYFSVKYNYWKKRGIPYLEPTFPFGSLGDVLCLRKSLGETFENIYKRLEGNKYGGIFQLHRPSLVLRDPETIKNFLTKDFAHFHDRGMFFDEKREPLTGQLFLMPGQKWRNLRAKLTPTFTSGKMKMMFQTLVDCGKELKECVKEEASLGETIEVKDIIARYSTDVIASCAFGIQCNCLKDPNAEFRSKGKEIFDPTVKTAMAGFLNVLVPSIGRIVNFRMIPKHISDFFLGVVRDTIEYREKNNVTRNDFMHLMIQLKNKGYVDVDNTSENESTEQNTDDVLKKLTLDEVAAQAFVFFVAGFETSSTLVSFCLYELALNPDIQARLRQEIEKVLAKHGGQITYDSLQEMEYLDQVVAETLRKYPPVPILNRECTVAYPLPGTDVVLEVGTAVIVPVQALHHDPKYYPDPQRFDPERFTAEGKASRHHYTYLPFGEGPRVCIGMRFGLMQSKVAVISLLTSYEFRVSKKTANPLVMDPKTFTMSPIGGISLQLVTTK